MEWQHVSTGRSCELTNRDIAGHHFSISRSPVTGKCAQPLNDYRAFLQAVRNGFANHQIERCAFKIVENSITDTKMVAKVLVSISGNQSGTFIEQNQKWQTVWRIDARSKKIALQRVNIVEIQKARFTNSNGLRLLSDQTHTVLQDADSYHKQLAYWSIVLAT